MAVHDASVDVWTDLAILSALLIGGAYCLRQLQHLSRVSLELHKADCAERALLHHREAQLESLLHISRLVEDGARAFLLAEFRFLALFVAAFCWLVGAAAGKLAFASFLVGCGAAILAGYLGMRVATYANARAALEAWRSLGSGYHVALRAGCVCSFSLVCIGVGSLYALVRCVRLVLGPEDPELWPIVSAFVLGVSSIGLFARVGGGVFTKAADIGADLSGHLDFGLSEDDYRNPACIADNVGDIVGGVVGIGADVLGSLAGAICAAFMLAGASEDLEGCDLPPLAKGIGLNWRAMLFPLLIAASSILTGIMSKFLIDSHYTVNQAMDVKAALEGLIKVSALMQTLVVYGLAHWCLPPVFALSCSIQAVTPFLCSITIWLGLWSGVLMGYSTEYYTSSMHTPVQEIAASQEISAASGVIVGLAVGYSSCAIPVACLATTILVAHALVGPYGVALSALGMLSVLSMSLAMEAYDSIADSAAGLAEMSGLNSDVGEITDVLGGAGAISNGFAIGSALLVGLALLHAFWIRAALKAFDAVDRWYFTGLLLGSSLPYAFSATTMRSVGKAAEDMVEECRRQFPGIINSYENPDYERCITISTEASLKGMTGPAGLLAIAVPLASGMAFGKRCTAGLLQGALISGVQLAISMINTGGAWDNAKKYVASRGLKDSDQHKNAVISDTVGDPLKDVSGPSLNVLITLSTSTCLVFGLVISSWSNDNGGPFWLDL